MDKLRFGIIGCGRIGSRRAGALKNLDAEVVCINDVNEDIATKLASDIGCEYYKNYSDIAKRNDIDCVIVATSNKFHMPIVISMLESGKHVFCEKPLARNPEEAKAMVEAADKNNVFLKTGSNLRYFSNVKKAKELLDSKIIGKPLFVRGWVGHDIIKWAENNKNSWFFNKDIVGGGTLLDNGVHILDLFRWFLGDFDECMGFVKTILLPIGTEDNGFGIFKSKDGKAAFMQSSWTEWCGYMYMEIYGSEGYIYIDNRREVFRNGVRTNASETIVGDKNGAQQIFDFSNEPPKSYDLEMRDYIDAVQQGRQPLASGYDGMKAVEMVHGIYESSKTGRLIKI